MSNFTQEAAISMPAYLERIVRWLKRYAFEILLICFILYTCVSRGMTIGINIHDPEVSEQEAADQLSFSAVFPFDISAPSLASIFNFEVLDHTTFISVEPSSEVQAMLTASQSESAITSTDAHEHVNAIEIAAPASDGQDDFNSIAETDDPAPHISNLTLVLSPDYGVRKGLAPEIIRAKKARVQRYLDRYSAAAQDEMRTYGIPASITLAQGLLESNAGDSKLARKSNNHFGIKCRSKCLGCTCRNYGDDTRYDMFRVFDSVADSYREHSILLNSKRYARLKNYGLDYKKWAHGLKACGYATDKRYAHKLIKIIEELKLDAYDELLGV